jgi:hypothetical protein
MKAPQAGISGALEGRQSLGALSALRPAARLGTPASSLKSGAYKNHFKIVPKDWHDWDVSNPPALIQTMGGKSGAERWISL